MAPEGTAGKRTRTPSRRLSATEKRQKAIDSVDAELAKAGVSVVRAAEGLVAAGKRDAAKRCLAIWESLLDVTAEPAAETEPAAAPAA